MSRVADEQERIDAEAADWLAAIECGSADREAFEQWRACDPRHALTLIRLSRIDSELGALRAARLSDAPPQPRAVPQGPATSRRKLLAFGAVSVLAAGLSGFGWTIAAAAHEAETALGERRRIVVASGIAIELNTDSHIEWRHRDGRYDIRLLRGEVMLERGAEGLPCRLRCHDSEIDMAAGARVNARFRTASVDLLMLDGEASFRTTGANAAIRLPALRKASLAAGAPPSLSTISPVEASTVSAWRQGQLYFNGKRLDEAVKEYNRYLPRPIEIADPAIRTLRLGGRFSATDPTDFYRALEEIYGVSAHQEAGRTRLARS